MSPWVRRTDVSAPNGRFLKLAICFAALVAAGCMTPSGESNSTSTDPAAREYPWHTGIVSTVFWVGEILDPDASDGSQEISTYDSNWMANYGGCDGVVVNGSCETEARVPDNDFFPSSMKPLQNPFYLDLPFDDVNNEEAFDRRGAVIPWANDPGYAGKENDRSFSYMKNRWVQIEKDGATCYGQIQDAGPGKYNDAEYVFGDDDIRPENTRFNGAGMDVSPALAGCLGFEMLDGLQTRVDWRFVEESDVPSGPWRKLVTTSPVVPFG